MTDSTQWEEAYRMLWNAAWSPILLEARSWKHESWGSKWVPRGALLHPMLLSYRRAVCAQDQYGTAHTAVKCAVNERQQVYKSSRLLGALYSSIPTP